MIWSEMKWNEKMKVKKLKWKQNEWEKKKIIIIIEKEWEYRVGARNNRISYRLGSVRS